MDITSQTKEILDQLGNKFDAIDQNTDTHLQGLLYSKPITYWDYIQTDALLNLQVQRTTLPDEMVFIMYHQVNELLFKMILWEIQQISHSENIQTAFFAERLMRISRYFDMLTTSFDIMGDGMEVDQYMKFRNTLTPASGFQSAQYRLIEFSSSKTSYLLLEFERKYKNDFLRHMQEYNTINLWQKFKQLPETDQKNPELIKAMRHYDHTVNITWVMGHLNAARKYIDSGKGSGEATGGSDWKKYMHPKYQRRIFFPELWTKEELEHWGEE